MSEPTFEENLTKLETIVTNLEQGNVPLEEALAQFKTGITLSNQLNQTLKQAEETVTKMMTTDDQEVAFDPNND
ncbi:exodeoxyribonuclease VII small subunit [Lacticaseibacillus brantae]|uniref:Exodeoxyribonuclease 7 small subunit n=1 Tax=Lacticaseibacillus brantae DSM 23927 TaxID=1423727 RepID=A0A0R2B232_9LACO|nr:exodeoxyribonuclease VII small subunit [Lacticaseibacillus brantae]KRM72818.1 hypothetical protein FC34_GL000529 [Lacticaseibacillus brantae DSM 23927]